MSGGGYRSLLTGGGVIQGLDGRDSNVSTSGLYQAMSYQAGLSGGGWLLSSLAGNNYPTVSFLKDKLWKKNFQESLLDPGFLISIGPYFEVVKDIALKELSGYDTTLVDVYGRLLSYQLLDFDGDPETTMSSLASMSNFKTHKVPFPIITALGVKTWEGQCLPGPNATTYEFNPFEFGSWDSDISAFAQIKYLGTPMDQGKPSRRGILKCTNNYDNLGYIMGTSSNLFNFLCSVVPPAQNSTSSLVETLAQILSYSHELATSDQYAIYRNPFKNYKPASTGFNPANNVQAQNSLKLVDGGEALQNNPLFPLLQPARKISAIIVNDNSADTKFNFPNGSEILTTYVQSFNQKLTRMPFIPSVETFLANGLDKKPTFFGCNDTSKITIVYIPNAAYSTASNVSTSQLVYRKEQTEAMIANGVQIITQGGKPGWATCLGCGLMMKTGERLPDECQACFREYCYLPPTR